MTNFFAGIHRATDALTTARYGLQVTGDNIANADTPGYTRRAARQQEVGATVGVARLHMGNGDEWGVRALGAERLNDPVLDRRVRTEHARSADVDTQATRLADLENIFHEPSDNGLSEQLHGFWNSWGDVANDPGNKVPRQMLISSAQSTVTKLHQMNDSLDSVATAASQSLTAQVKDVNSAATELTDLNRKIAIGDATGEDINTLLDRRDVLLNKLSTAVGATATIATNGTASVTVGGHTLVQGGSPPSEVAGSLSMTQADSTAPATITITDVGGGSPADLVNPLTPKNVLTDSTMAAEVHALNDTVPSYRGKLDAVAQKLATTVNDQQSKGYDLTGIKGADMFDNGGNGTDPVTAANISLTSDFINTDAYEKVAAADTQSLDASSNPIGNVNGDNALDAANLGSDPNGPDKAYSSLVGTLGRASAAAQNQQATQGVITNSVDSLQAQSSGVSFDEEVSNMLTYQRAYQASARVLTTMDDMLNTLINRTGMVGR